MKSRAKGRVTGILPYEGKWIGKNFILIRVLQRSDLLSPNIRPSFLLHIDSGERLLLGWTPQGKQCQYYVKNAIPESTIENVKGFIHITDTIWKLELSRTRGAKWHKITESIKKQMAAWFQGRTS